MMTADRLFTLMSDNEEFHKLISTQGLPFVTTVTSNTLATIVSH